MPLKVTVFYNQTRNGFTETMYSNTEDPKAFCQGWSAADLYRLVYWRATGTYLYAMKAALIGSPRVSFTRLFTTPGNQYYPVPSASKAPDIISSDAVFRLYDAGNGSAIHYFRGLPDTAINRDPTSGQDIPAPPLIDGVNEWVKAFVNNGASLRSQKRPPTADGPWFPVTNVSGSAPNSPYTFIETPTQTSINLSLYPQVVFQGVPRDDLPGFPLIASIVSQTTTSPFGIVVRYRYRGALTTTQPVKMKFVVLTYNYAALAGAPTSTPDFEKFAERKAGRPFGVQRGRARSVVKAQ